MEKLVVVANFTCYDACEDDLYTSQWLVGIFDTVDECISASLKDLGKVASDHFECILNEEEFDSEEDYYDALAENVENYCCEHWERRTDDILVNLKIENSAEIVVNDFTDDEYTDQRQAVKYYIHKV
jgi:hypothetical protein